MPVPQYLPPAIEVIHAGMQEEQDPKHVQALSGCLRVLTSIQADYMQQSGGAGGNGPPGQMMGQMMGGGGGGPRDPREALLAQLGGGG